MRSTYLAFLFAFSFGVATAQNSAPLAAPGLRVPGGSLPYALDRFQDKPELVPAQNAFSTVVFDFAIDSAAPNAADAVMPGSDPE